MDNREAIYKLQAKRENYLNSHVKTAKSDIGNIYYAGLSWKDETDELELIDLAISALEKQTAKKTIVKFHKDWDADFPYCPVCDTPIDIVDDYCYKCGQRLGEE
jgi:hypothetical protein